jgi:uncharacterized phiE125 gp8 family phage protein
MQTTTITEAPYDSIELDAAKKYLRIYGDNDVELLGTIASAIDWCEHRTGRTLRTAVERRTTMAAWCDLKRSLPWQPVLAIEALSYIDEDGEEQTVDEANYRLIASADGAAVIELDSEFDLPTLATRSDAIRLDYTTGYEDVELIPPRALQAIKVALKIFWGDLEANEVAVWERCAAQLLGLVEWGSYR